MVDASSFWFANPGGSDFYNGIITSSCRLNGSNSRLASPAFGSDLGDTWTWSAWVKFNNQNTDKRGVLFGMAGNNASLYFDSSGQSFLSVNDDGAAVRSTSRLLRDPSSWYHIVLNGNGTLNKLWINGELATFGTNANLGSINTAAVHYIGFSINSAYYFEGQIADINFVSQTALDYTAFAEEKKGVLIPKEPSVTYGANGFRLQFLKTGSGADANGIGADTSGNNKHFTATNLDAYDVLPDSPENNFCTWNPLSKSSGITLSEGNLKAIASSGNIHPVKGTMALPLTGKWYWEIRLVTLGYLDQIGIADDFKIMVNSADGSAEGRFWGFGTWFNDNNSSVSKYQVNVASSGGTTWTGVAVPSAGDILMVAYDADNGTLWFGKNDSWYNSSGTANPATNTDPRFSSLTGHEWFAWFAASDNGPNPTYIANFGQDGSFAGALTGAAVGDETDGNGFGLFKYAPPSGFLSLCSANLEEPTIGANSATQADDYFETVLYTGDGSTQNVAVNFQPDFTWIKNRDAADAHQLFDSTRLATNVLESDDTTVEVANDDTLTDFTPADESIGFSLGDDVTVNTGSESYVAWNWKANGGTATSFSESGNNPAGTHQANTTAGFSIVTYTGTGSAGTVAHGVQVNGEATAPSMIIAKARGTPNSSARSWFVYHRDLGASAFMYLDLNNAQVTSNTTVWGGVTPSTTVFSLGNEPSVNFDGENYIAYCFAEVEGYSKIGSFSGNTSADGTFVALNFSPAFLLVKSSISGSYSWYLFDNTRNPHNVGGLALFADTPAVEYSSVPVDFLSNGFKWRTTDGGVNNADYDPYIYMAFAESPFKYANAK